MKPKVIGKKSCGSDGNSDEALLVSIESITWDHNNEVPAQDCNGV
jgi:hypothetical protein